MYCTIYVAGGKRGSGAWLLRLGKEICSMQNEEKKDENLVKLSGMVMMLL